MAKVGDAARTVGEVGGDDDADAIVSAAEAEAVELFLRWKLQPSGLPRAPSSPSAPPVVCMDAGATLVCVMAQLRGEGAGPHAAAEAAATADGSRSVEPPPPPSPPPLPRPPPDTTPGMDFVDRCLMASDDPQGQARLLAELVESLAGLTADATAALLVTGIASPIPLLQANRDELNGIGKRAGLTLGVRLRLGGAVGRLVAQMGERGGTYGL
jgi:hypothetical protein